MPGKSHSRSVGRPRIFDEQVALNAVLESFWRRGYEATSLADLCEATGLHKGSLYQAFGDKHQLFMRALTSYAEQQAGELVAVASQADSPLAGLRAIVGHLASRAGNERGCLLINSMVELAPHDREVRNTLRNIGRRQVGMLTGLIARGQQAGQIRPELSPEKLARQLMVTLAGGAATVKGILEPHEVREVLEELIDAWT
ncbi:MAG: TetR/AcrR family transcriptional regulator [Rhodocyclaceae bacterium]|nr:TetR/AcrR family transcriptional regulator [Rhodocyclaceae bacterium]